MFLKWLLLLFVVIIQTDCQKSNITILKCCEKGQVLNVTEETNDFFCVSGKDSFPLGYSATKNNYLKEMPSNWIVKSPSLPDCGSNRIEFLKNSEDVLAANFLLFETGELHNLETSKLIKPGKYCFSAHMAMICTDKPPEIKVKKCCGPGAVFSELKNGCIAMNGKDYVIDIGSNKKLVQGYPHCNSDLITVGKLHEGELFDNGSLKLPGVNTVLKQGTFCLEHLLENASGSASIITCNHHIPTRAPTTTPSGGLAPSYDDIRFRLYPAGLLLSAVFLAATLLAGAALPAAHHHALHWRCQTHHVACLLVGDVLLATTQLIGRVKYGFCVTLAVVMHFSFLAAFFWLNTMCFNIWWTFRDLRPGSMEKRAERCRLRVYGIYAWGVPLVIAVVALTLNSVPDNPDLHFLRPRYGEVTCWFPGDMEILTYFFGPIGILLFINLLLFAATARELTCGLWKRELVKSTTERAALGRVCMKLVVVMGVTWIADVLSWAVGGPQSLWYITDLINALQGVFIFIVVACQPQVWTAIKRLWCRRQSLTADITGNGNHHSSSSHGLPSYGESVTNHSVSNTTRSVPIETSC